MVNTATTSALRCAARETHYRGMVDTSAPSAPAYPIARAHVNSLDQYRELYERSLRDPDGFWSEVAERLT